MRPIIALVLVCACGRTELDAPEQSDEAIPPCMPGGPMRVLASKPGLSIRTIVVGGGRVYFDTGAAEIDSVTTSGTKPGVVWALDASGLISFGATRDDLVFGNTKAIVFAPLPGGPSRTGPDIRYLQDVLAVPDGVFAIDYERYPARVARIDPSTFAVTSIAAPDPNVYNFGLIATRDHVYAYPRSLLDPKKLTQNLLRISISNGTFELRTLPPFDPNTAFFSGVRGFFIRRPKTAQMEVSFEYVAEPDLAITTVSHDSDILPSFVDEDGFYALVADGIDRIALDGSRRPYLRGVPLATAMALDSSCVYIASGNSLLRVPRP